MGMPLEYHQSGPGDLNSNNSTLVARHCVVKNRAPVFLDDISNYL